MKRLFREAGALTWLFVGAIACAVVVSVSTIAFADIFGRSVSLVVSGAGLQALRQLIVISVALLAASVADYEGDQARRREHAGLSHAPAETLAPAPRLVD